MDKEKDTGNIWSVDTEGTKTLLKKARTQKTFKFYKDDNLSKELYLIPYSVCIRPSEDNMSLLSLFKTFVWCGYASENYWTWCKDAKEAKEVSFYEYIDELIKATQLQTRKETAREILTKLKNTRLHKGKLTYDFEMAVNRLAKQYGVEAEE